MSLDFVEHYLRFADQVVYRKGDLPDEIDAIEVENTLVSHGVVLLYAHMEQCFRKALEVRCNRCSDVEVRTFALSVKDEKAGRISMESVKGTLKRFGAGVRDMFKADLEASNLSESWDSVKNQRARVAHSGKPASITLTELDYFYNDIRKVLGFICKALGLDAKEAETISPLIDFPSSATA